MWNFLILIPSQIVLILLILVFLFFPLFVLGLSWCFQLGLKAFLTIYWSLCIHCEPIITKPFYGCWYKRNKLMKESSHFWSERKLFSLLEFSPLFALTKFQLKWAKGNNLSFAFLWKVYGSSFNCDIMMLLLEFDF